MDDTPASLSAEAIACSFGRASQAGSVTWRCDCPVCGYPCCSVNYDDDGSVGFLCYSCRDVKGIREQAQARGLIASGAGSKLARAALVAEGRKVWDGGVPVEGTEASTYLMSRGLAPPYPDKVRAESHGQPYYDDGLLWAWRLLCLVEHPTRGILGVHATGLNDGGRRKGYSNHGYGRKRGSSIYRRYGVLDGGGVWLGTPGGELVVGEGLETTLSAMLILGCGRGVAALGAAGMKRLDLPETAERVCIAADNDDDGAGQKAAAEAKARWLNQGRTVRIATPNTPGTDFNDILKGRNNRE